MDENKGDCELKSLDSFFANVETKTKIKGWDFSPFIVVVGLCFCVGVDDEIIAIALHLLTLGYFYYNIRETCVTHPLAQ